MRLDHEFTVPVPAAQAWPVLLDVDRIAPCMPGATVTKVDGDDFEGTVKVKVGPITVTYGGTASFLEKDEAQRIAVIEARGKETRGSGTATAPGDRAAVRQRRRLDQGCGDHRPVGHRQAGPVRPRRDERRRQQAARPVRRLPGRRAGRELDGHAGRGAGRRGAGLGRVRCVRAEPGRLAVSAQPGQRRRHRVEPGPASVLDAPSREAEAIDLVEAPAVRWPSG